MRCFVAFLLVLASLTPATSQTVVQKSPRNQSLASTNGNGALVIETDTAGTLYVDGAKHSALIANAAVRLKLMPGQHIIELKDANGNSLWKEVVTVVRGEQLVRQVNSTTAAGSAKTSEPRTTPSGAELRRWEELALVGRVGGPISCLTNATDCEGVWDNPLSINCADISPVKTNLDNNYLLIHKAIQGPDCAQSRYQRGEYQDALMVVNGSLESREYLARTTPSTAGLVEDPTDVGRLLVLRGLVKYALHDPTGALVDLQDAMDRYTEYHSKLLGAAGFSPDAKTPPELADLKLKGADLAKQLLQLLPQQSARIHLYRSLILFQLGKYTDSNREYNEFISDNGSEVGVVEKKFGGIIQQRLKHLDMSGTQVSGDGSGAAPVVVPMVASVPRLNGDWTCDSFCQSARLTVRGDSFSGILDLGIDTEHIYSTEDGHSLVTVEGSISKRSIEGLATEPSRVSLKDGCEIPSGTHPFTATVSDDDRSIVIHTEINSWNTSGSTSKQYPWSVGIKRCEAHLDHSEALRVVLRTTRVGGVSSIGGSTVPRNDIHAVRPPQPSKSDSGPDLDSSGLSRNRADLQGPSGIQNAIDRIAASQHSSLPPVQAGAGDGPIVLQNKTSSTLTVYFSGVDKRQEVIPPLGVVTLTLKPGPYKVAGELSDKSVRPFFGVRIYSGGEKEMFYIGTTQN